VLAHEYTSPDHEVVTQHKDKVVALRARVITARNEGVFATDGDYEKYMAFRESARADLLIFELYGNSLYRHFRDQRDALAWFEQHIGTF
jgi:hypothetical protein